MDWTVVTPILVNLVSVVIGAAIGLTGTYITLKQRVEPLRIALFEKQMEMSIRLHAAADRLFDQARYAVADITSQVAIDSREPGRSRAEPHGKLSDLRDEFTGLLHEAAVILPAAVVREAVVFESCSERAARKIEGATNNVAEDEADAAFIRSWGRIVRDLGQSHTRLMELMRQSMQVDALSTDTRQMLTRL